MGEPVLLEVGVDDAEELALVLEGQLLHLLKAAEEAPARGRARPGGLDGLLSEELVDGDAEGVGEGGEDVAGREGVALLVVGDHAVGDSAELLELALGESSGESDGSEPVSEVLGGERCLSRHGRPHG